MEFSIATNNITSEVEDIKKFDSYNLQQRNDFQFLTRVLTLMVISTASNSFTKVFNGIVTPEKDQFGKTVTNTTKIMKHNCDKYITMLGWLPLEVIKKKIYCNTQLEMGLLLQIPFMWHQKSRNPQLNVSILVENFAIDKLFSSETVLGVIICAQLFVGTNSKLTKVFEMKTESEVT